MRFGFLHFGRAAVGFAALGLLAGCARGEADLAEKFGCGMVDGLGFISGEQPPAYVIVGEVIETNEAPAAFAELACRLAAQQPKDRPLWVGMPDYIGGPTDAIVAMRRRLGDLIAMGAPIVLGQAGDGHTTGASRQEEAERRWADAIMASVKAAKAGRALLLLSRRDGVAARVTNDDGRFEDYTPMPLFLPEGQMINLEIGQAPNIGPPTIRIYLETTRGYMGQITLEKVTLARKPDLATLQN